MIRRKTLSRIRSSNGASSYCRDKRIVVVIRTTLALLLAALVVLHQRLLLHQTSTLLSSYDRSDHHRFLNYDNSTSEASAGSEAVVNDAALMSGRSSKAAPTMTTTPGTVAQRIGTDKQQPSASGQDNDDDVWLTMNDFDVYLDAFSDSWYMSLETFLETDLTRMEEIEAVEEACFVMFEDREERVRMALDWLDLGVEHMSKWWKVLEAPQNEYANNRVRHYFDQYVAKRLRSIRRDDLSRVLSLLHPTVALVAFQQYKVRGTLDDDNVRQRCEQLTVSSLSATIASLIEAGMGRIVVVGHDTVQNVERWLVNQAFSRFASDLQNHDNITTIHEGMEAFGTQLAYVTVPDDMVRTDFMAVNVPRGALLGLRHALERNDPEWTSRWLGSTASSNNHPWKFVYLTEPDTILHARPASFAGMERMLQRGMILVPHRLQPVPYEGDVPESNQSHLFITGEQLAASASPNILELDIATASAAVCCDEQMGTLRPGPKAAVAAGLGSRCGWDRWWLCGFDQHNSSQPHQGNHSLILDHYQLIRLRQGTGVTLISGSSHGRRCFPTLHGTCTRRMRPPTQQALVRPKNPWITPKRLQERRARNQNASIISTV